MPGANALQSAGVSVFQPERLGNLVTASQSFQSLGGRGDAQEVSTLIFSGERLAILPKKMVERILAKEYIDFADLPPAKGKV